MNLFVAKHGISVAMTIVTLGFLTWSLWYPVSPAALPGMYFGAGLEREVGVYIEGQQFNKVPVPPRSLSGVYLEFEELRDLPTQHNAREIAEYLLARRWQQPERLLEQTWGVRLIYQPPQIVEDWHHDPPEINLVEVDSVEVGVFALQYDPTSSTLTSKRLVWVKEERP